MAMPLIHCRIRAHAVEIAFACDVVEPDAFGTIYDEIEGMVIMRAIAILERYELFCSILNIVHDFPCAPRVFTSEPKDRRGANACVPGTLVRLS